MRWVVDGYVPQGFSVLAGRQKTGKTWLAFDWALAVAQGGYAMGSIKVDQGDVLYVDLENGERRIQQRIRQMHPDWQRLDLSRLNWMTAAPALDDSFIEAIDHWRQSFAEPRLIVIDVLQRIKPPGVSTRNAYENDYSIWAPLQRWATEHDIGVVGLHHLRKGGMDDPLESLSGSNGLSAVADTTLVLKNLGGVASLYVRGRDVDEKEMAMRFDQGLWNIQGEAAVARLSNQRMVIAKVIAESAADNQDGVTAKVIAEVTGYRSANVKQLLHKMKKDGSVRLGTKRGHYLPVIEAILEAPDNLDNR